MKFYAPDKTFLELTLNHEGDLKDAYASFLAERFANRIADQRTIEASIGLIVDETVRRPAGAFDLLKVLQDGRLELRAGRTLKVSPATLVSIFQTSLLIELENFVAGLDAIHRELAYCKELNLVLESFINDLQRFTASLYPIDKKSDGIRAMLPTTIESQARKLLDGWTELSNRYGTELTYLFVRHLDLPEKMQAALLELVYEDNPHLYEKSFAQLTNCARYLLEKSNFHLTAVPSHRELESVANLSFLSVCRSWLLGGK